MKVVIVPYTGVKLAVEAVFTVAGWCEANGHDAVLIEGDAYHPFESLPHETLDAIGTPDLVVALGGDGTILRAVRKLGRRCGPVLGVNFGRLGFLTGADADELIEALEAAANGTARIERRAKVLARAYCGEELLGSFEALNEVVVARAPGDAVLTTRLDINGHDLYTLNGDGLIVASATGSTAYALSAGGPVVSPGYRGMVVVPLASHSLVQRAIVTASSDVVRVHFPDLSRAKPVLTYDGFDAFPDCCPEGTEITEVTAEVSDHYIELIKLDSRLFYDTVAEEFFPTRG